MPSTSANNTNCASSSPPSTMLSASSSAPVASPPPTQSDWAISNYDSRTTEAPDVERELRRLQNLKLYNLLDVPQPTCFQRYCQLACHIFQTSMSAVTLVDLGRLYIVAGHGFPASIEHIREVPRCVSFCAHTILSKHDVVVVPDASLDARFAHIPLVAGPAQTRFYAGANLITPPDPTTGTTGGQRLGCMTVLDSKPRHDWTEAHTALLQHLACMVMDLMEEQRKALIAVGSKQKQKHRQQQHTDAATHAIDQSAQRLSLHGGDRGRVDNDVDDSNNSNSNILYKNNQHEHDNRKYVNVAEEKNSQSSFHSLLGTEPSGTEPQLPTLPAPGSSSLFQQSLPTDISAAAARVVKHLHQVQQEQDQQPLHNHNDEVLSSYLGTRKALDDATYVLQSLLSFQSCHQQQEQQQQQLDAHAATSIRTTNDMMWTATEPLVDNAHLEALTTSVLRSAEDTESAPHIQQQPQQPAVSEKNTSIQWATDLASDIFSSSQAPQPSRQSQQRVGIVCTVQVSTLLEHLNFVMQSYPSYASSAASASTPSSLSSSLLTRDAAVPIYFRMDPDMPQHIVLPDDLKVFRSSIALLASAYERTRHGYVRFSIGCKERINSINNNPTTTATTQRMVVFECEDTGPNLTWEQYQDMVAPPPTSKRRSMPWSGGLHNDHHHDQWDDPSLFGNNSNSSNNHHIDCDSDHGTSSDGDCIQVDPVTGQILKSSHCASLTVVASTLFGKEQRQQHQTNTTDTSPSLNAAQSLTLDKKQGNNHNTTIRHNRGDGCLPLSIHAVVKYIGSIPGGDYGFRPRNGDAGMDVASSSVAICTNTATTTTNDVATSPTTKTILTAPTTGSVFWFCFPLQEDILATATITSNQD